MTGRDGFDILGAWVDETHSIEVDLTVVETDDTFEVVDDFVDEEDEP